MGNKLVIKDGVCVQSHSAGPSLAGTLTIPDGPIRVAPRAFHEFTSLTALELPRSLRSIGREAFRGCVGLAGTLIIPEGITRLDSMVFYECVGFTALELPRSLRTVGERAFCGCAGQCE